MRASDCTVAIFGTLCVLLLTLALFWLLGPLPNPLAKPRQPEGSLRQFADVQRTEDPLPAEIVLPVVPLHNGPGSHGADKGARDAIVLYVNERGQVLRISDQIEAPERVITRAFGDAKVEAFLKHRAEAAFAAADQEGWAAPRLTVVLLADARTPFEKTHGIVWAARRAGYVEFRWVAMFGPEWGNGVHFETHWSRREGLGADLRCTVRLTAEAGKLAKITFRGPGMADGVVDLGTDFEELYRELAAAGEKHPDAEWPVLIAEIDGQLLQADVIRLFATTIRTGFLDVRPMLLDLKKS